MTAPEDSQSGTRPISVAELLAKNGTIGAPPVGGRRRRRRGNSESVTVAELTGEIPIIAPENVDQAVDQTVDEEHVQPTGPLRRNGSAGNGVTHDSAVSETVSDDVAEPVHEPEPVAEDDYPDDEYAEAVAEYTAHLDARDADPEPVEFMPARPHYAHAMRRHIVEPAVVGAEQMSPDPVLDDEDALDAAADLVADDDAETTATRAAVDIDDELPSYLRSTQGALFGGQTVADDNLARRGLEPLADDLDDDDLEPTERSGFVHALLVIGQCVVAVVFGAGLFVAFDQLWKWNNIVALVLSVLVILGLVVGVRVVRKTEDIASTLIAVAVGALVTLGPLALLQSG